MNRIKEHREKRGWSMIELARRVEPPTSAQQIERLEKGARKLSQPWMERIAAALGTTPHELLPAQEYIPNTSENRSRLPGNGDLMLTDTPLRRARGDIVPLRLLQGGVEGAMTLASEVVDQIERSPLLRGIAGAYCVEVRGDGLKPLLREGSILHINPFRRPRREDIVLVFTGDGPDESVMVKLYNRQTEVGYELGHLSSTESDKPPTVVPLANVVAMHVVETIDR